MNQVRLSLFILFISVVTVHCQTPTAKKSLNTLSPELIEVIEKRIADGVSPSMAIALSHKVRHGKAGNMGVAMGWHIKSGDEGDVIWHNGGTGGYRTFAGFVKETGIGVVLLTNSSLSSDDIGFHLLDPGSDLAVLKSKKEAVDVPEATLEQYVGIYELTPDFKITITKEGMQLFLQATGQPRFEIYPENDTKFYLTVVEASISFQRKNGVVESLTLFQGGQEMPGKKVE